MRKITMKKRGRTAKGESNGEESEVLNGSTNEKKRGRNSLKEDDDENSNPLSEQASDVENDDMGSPDKKKRKANNKKSVGRKARGKENNAKGKNGSKENEDEEADYEVEAVIDDRRIRKSRQYLIRWKGYSSEHDTWEPESTLNCPELLQKYKEAKKKAKKEVDETDDNTEYEVDRILEVHFKKNGKREFLISWKGYSTSERTWEPEENMECTDLIDKFMKKVEKAKNYAPHTLRSERKPTERFTLTTKDSGRRISKRNSQHQRVRYVDCE